MLQAGWPSKLCEELLWLLMNGSMRRDLILVRLRWLHICGTCCAIARSASRISKTIRAYRTHTVCAVCHRCMAPFAMPWRTQGRWLKLKVEALLTIHSCSLKLVRCCQVGTFMEPR